MVSRFHRPIGHTQGRQFKLFVAPRNLQNEWWLQSRLLVIQQQSPPKESNRSWRSSFVDLFTNSRSSPQFLLDYSSTNSKMHPASVSWSLLVFLLSYFLLNRSRKTSDSTELIPSYDITPTSNTHEKVWVLSCDPFLTKLYSVKDEQMCLAFPTTLKSTAQIWFQKTSS